MYFIYLIYNDIAFNFNKVNHLYNKNVIMYIVFLNKCFYKYISIVVFLFVI